MNSTNSNLQNMNAESQNHEVYDLEDLVYDEFPESLSGGGAEYSKDHFLSLFNLGDSREAPEYLEDPNKESLVLEDSHGKYIFGVLEEDNGQVHFDVKSMGDASCLQKMMQNMPSEGYTKHMAAIKGHAYEAAHARTAQTQHPLNVETTTSMSPPGEKPEDSFTSTHAERIKREVMENEAL